MNNDISSNYNYVGAKNQAKPSKKKVKEAKTSAAPVQDSDFKSSMTFMGSMGCAQVRMKKALASNVQESVNQYVIDPDLAALQVEFCDSLVKRGQSLEDAVSFTGAVFDKLSDSKIYEQ